MRKSCVSLLGALALAMVAFGCGSDSGSSSGGGGTSTGASAGTSAEYDLRWADGAVPTLDPVKGFNQGTLRNAALVLEGLVQLDRDGKVQPALAESVEERDETTYVYKLREGVRFSDGRPLTIEDVLYSLERYRGRDSQNAGEYANVASIEAEGDNAVVVKLKQPDQTWQFVPTFAGYITQKAYTEKVGARNLGTPANLPLGTGPWKFDSYKPDAGIELSPNPNWRDGRTQARNISIRFIPDSSGTALALRSGEVDGTFNEPNVKTFGNIPSVNLLQTPAPDEFFLSFNTIVEPFDDVHVRRAIAYATNREGFVKSALSGAGTVNDTITPASLLANVSSQAEVDDMIASLRKYPYDLEAARSELAQSRYPDGFTTEVPIPSSLPEFLSLGQILAADLKQIGITLKIRETTDSDWLAILYGPRDKLGLFINKYGGAYPDPNQLLSLTLDPAQARVNGLNSANFRDATVGKLLDEQRSEPDGSKRLAAIGEILRISQEELPYQPVAQPKRMVAVSDKYVLSDFSPWLVLSPWALKIRPAA